MDNSNTQKYLKEFIELKNSVSVTFKPDIGDFVKVLTKSGYVDLAISISKDVKVDIENNLGIIAVQLVLQDKLGEAENLINSKIQSSYNKSFYLISIAKLFLEKNNNTMAKLYIDKAIRRADQADYDEKVKLFSQISTILRNIDQTYANQILEKISPLAKTTWDKVPLACALLEQGYEGKGLQIVENLDIAGAEISALAKISSIYYRQNNYELANELMNKAMLLLSKQPNNMMPNELDDIVAELSKQDRYEDLRKIFNREFESSLKSILLFPLFKNISFNNLLKLKDLLLSNSNLKSNYYKRLIDRYYLDDPEICYQNISSIFVEIIYDENTFKKALVACTFSIFLLHKLGNKQYTSILRILVSQLELEDMLSLPNEVDFSFEKFLLWIDQIKDQDYREQIELWAKWVEKGKMSEEEFSDEVNRLIKK